MPCCCAGLFFPEAFLIAVLQSHALQSKGTAVDKLSLAHVVLSAAPGPCSISKPPSVGVYIHGLHLEGARWGSMPHEGSEESDQLSWFWGAAAVSDTALSTCLVGRTAGRHPCLGFDAHSSTYVQTAHLVYC